MMITPNKPHAAATSKISRPIVLVGLMGAGKTNIGRNIAEDFGLDFCDSDDIIENIAGMPISTIFELYGEPQFRKIEAREISKLLDGMTKIISTGGGAFCQEKTRNIINARALSVWLKATPETLAGRISNIETRPLLKGKDPVQVLTALSAERQPHYQQAELTVDTEGLSLYMVAKKVKAAVLAALNPDKDHGIMT